MPESTVTINDASTGGGFWSPPGPGTYRAVLTGFSDGPMRAEYDKRNDPDAPKKPTIRWHFDIFNMAGEPVMYTPTDESGKPLGEPRQASADWLNNLSNGPGSNNRKAIQAILRREVKPGEKGAALMDECLSVADTNQVLLVFGQRGSRVTISDVLPFG